MMQISTVPPLVAATAALMLSLPAWATSSHSHGSHSHGHHPQGHLTCSGPDDCEATLDFSKLVAVPAKLEYEDVAGGGDLVVTANTGKLAIVLGELGVSSGGFPGNLDVRLGSGEAINFLFQDDVTLSSWDLDDLPFGSNQFSLSVDGGAAQVFSLDSHAGGPAAFLSGKSFTFGYAGDSYFIDKVKFTCIDAPVNPVPEPGSLALALGGLLMVGSLSRRRTKPS